MWGATAYLPPNTTFQYKFIRKERDGSVRISLFPRLGPVCESGHYLHVGWTDRVGVGPEQGGYHPAVGSAVDCDKLALKRRRT